ncbi:MAG: hypothetical protein SCARUB_01361 [Candidatus Scalindua rubra]|uniref:ArnR1-like winged helix-turn-helix domain-containing protein n=1 Tax=Candidatus Scalindua rubra TaxID=1872076 RepID=A0A1E3XD18_9BACT|nr:MAG: hypothetical protein SCARUB_01361 [Candidatus Scalindua rubra]
MPTPYQSEILRIIDNEGKGGECGVSLINRRMMLGTDFVRGLLDSMARVGLIDFIDSRRIRLTLRGLRALGKGPTGDAEEEKSRLGKEIPEERYKRWTKGRSSVPR